MEEKISRRMLSWRELFKIRDSILLLRRKLVSFLIDCKMRGRVTISLGGFVEWVLYVEEACFY